MEISLDAVHRPQRQRTPMPKLAAAVNAGTSWKTTGVKTNESRTTFPPSATRAVSSNRSDKSAVATAAPPTTQNGRALSGAGLRVWEPRADRRPISTEPQGRASTGPQRNRNGQASKLAASRVNAAVPPSSSIPVREAWLAPSSTAGDHSAGRSMPTMAYKATPGMTFGAGPSSACAATCTATLFRLRVSEGSEASAVCGATGWPASSDFAALGDAGAGMLALAAPMGASLVTAFFSRTAALGSSVTAMISATASAASPQLAPSTRRTDGFAPAWARETVPPTEPAGVAANSARMSMESASSVKRTRGERARTRAIKSARLVQPGLAFTWMRAAAAGAPGSAALATPVATPIASASASNAILVVTANDRIAP
jgi:hypothetical protein